MAFTTIKEKIFKKNVSSWGLPWWSSASNAEGTGSIPGRETKFLQAARPKKTKKNVNSQGEYSQPSVSSGSTDLTNKG